VVSAAAYSRGKGVGRSGFHANVAEQAMDGTPEGSLDRAERRLAVAIEALRGAVHRRREKERTGASLRAEAQAMADDRAKLAAELDRLRYRSKRLEDANRQAIARVDQVMGAVRNVLDTSPTAASGQGGPAGHPGHAGPGGAG
jgi:seryl-tRNA synthetase